MKGRNVRIGSKLTCQPWHDSVLLDLAFWTVTFLKLLGVLLRIMAAVG